MIHLDIAMLSMVMSQSHVQQQSSILVMKKAMGQAEQQGDALQNLLDSSKIATMERSVQPHLGGRVDVRL